MFQLIGLYLYDYRLSNNSAYLNDLKKLSDAYIKFL